MACKQRLIFSVLIASVLISLLMLSACNKGGDVAVDSLECQLRIDSYDHYQYLGQDETYEVVCDNPDKLPENPVYEWTFQAEDKTVLDTYIFDKHGELIKTDIEDYEFSIEGTNTIRVDLYDEDEFNAAANLAPRRGTVTIEVHVQALRVTIEAMPHGVGNIYTLNAKVDNPEYLPGAAVYYFWNFGDGTTDDKVDIPDTTHEFPDEGDFTVTVTLSNPFMREVFGQASRLVFVGETELRLIIDPAEIEWETNRGINFTVEAFIPDDITPEMLPESVIWEWDFGDDSGIITEEGRLTLGSSATHPYTILGEYEVRVTVRSSQATEVLAEVTTSVVISDLPYLKKTDRFSVYLEAWKKFNVGADLDGVFTLKNTNKMHSEDSLSNDDDWLLEWLAGNRFEAKTEWTTQDGINRTWELKGQVDTTGAVIIWLTVTDKYVNPDYQDTGRKWEWHRTYTLTDVRINKLSGGDTPSFYTGIEGEEVQQYVSDYYYEEIIEGWYGDEGDKKTTFDSFDWLETSMPAGIQIRFWK